jgi:subtilisin family serine protease
VVDTGVDETHPDLAGREVAEHNLSTAAWPPGAHLLDAKVVDDDGWAQDSAIIAGMTWAADQGAKIINLSLGADDRSGTDPVEATVEQTIIRAYLLQ